VEYNEYIVYKGAQAYPEYIIVYKHNGMAVLARAL